MQNITIIKDFLNSRENDTPIIASFGYGSGVFKQRGYNLDKKNMIDLILVVENAKKWHHENKKKHPNDYQLSAKILLGNINFERIFFLTGVTYQTHISFQGQLFKYGIISESTFINQMNTWSSFFLPGRFQKPICPIKSTTQINDSIANNRLLALLVALYTLPEEQKTLEKLFLHICSLSYLGDIRMLFVENPNKISNIVSAEFSLFRKIYGVPNPYFQILANNDISINYENVYRGLQEYLPEKIKKAFNKKQENLLRKIERINRVESITQPIVGLATVGPITSLKYIHEKMLKKEKRF